jgi:hypothetical protein
VIDGVVGLLLGGIFGLFLGGYFARVLHFDGPLHPVVGVRLGPVSGAVAGALTGPAAAWARSVGARAAVVGVAAVAGALACLPVPGLDVWPGHLAGVAAELGWAEVLAVGLVYGALVGWAVGHLNRPRGRRNRPGAAPQPQG